MGACRPAQPAGRTYERLSNVNFHALTLVGLFYVSHAPHSIQLQHPLHKVLLSCVSRVGSQLVLPSQDPWHLATLVHLPSLSRSTA